MSKITTSIIILLILCIVALTFWSLTQRNHIHNLRQQMLDENQIQEESQGLSEALAVFWVMQSLYNVPSGERRDTLLEAEKYNAASRACDILLSLPDDGKDMEVFRIRHGEGGDEPFITLIDFLASKDKLYGTDRAARLKAKLSGSKTQQEAPINN